MPAVVQSGSPSAHSTLAALGSGTVGCSPGYEKSGMSRFGTSLVSGASSALRSPRNGELPRWLVPNGLGGAWQFCELRLIRGCCG